jgi:hypothetical protein
MKAIFVEVADLAAVVVGVLSLFLRFKRSEAHAKDLGDGGIQKLFVDKKPK